MKVTAIILSYNGLEDTLECLESLKRQTLDKNTKLDVTVVDNNSQDGSQEALSKLKDITLLENSENLGYSGGMNIGIKNALKKNSDYILVLNNDIVCHEGLVSNLLKNKQKAEIISPKIYFAKGYEFHKDRYKETDLGKIIWYAGGKIDWDNIVGIHFGVDEVDSKKYSIAQEIDFATGACMLIEKNVFEKIGLFDEKYFLYLEDLDFSYRAKKAGFKIFFEPNALVWHKNAASAGGSGSKIQDYYFTRNRLLFAFKFARLRTKMAVFKQALLSINQNVKRTALIDFLFLRFGKGSGI